MGTEDQEGKADFAECQLHYFPKYNVGYIEKIVINQNGLSIWVHVS